jgi:hypothetical protein
LTSFDPSWVDDSQKFEEVPDGVWIVREKGFGGVQSIHPNELSALRAANSACTQVKAEFIPWGKILIDVNRSSGGRQDA